MPSVITFIKSVWSALGAFKIGGVAILQQAVVSFAIGQVLQKLGEKKVEPTELETSIKLNNTSNVSPIPVIYGTRIVGGSEYRAVSGADNKYLHRAVVLSEGEIDSIPNIFLNDINVTDSRYSGFVQTQSFTGTTSQNFSSIMVGSGEWDTTYRGKGIAYVAVQLTYDRDVFASGLPIITAEVKGKKVYDPRLDDGGTQLVTDLSRIANTAPLQDGSTYKDLITNASGHPDVNDGNLRIWHRDYNGGSGTVTSSYSYDVDTDTMTITATRNSGSAYFGSYFRIGALKEGVYYRVTGKARVVTNTTGATVKATVDLSDNNDPNEFKEETTSSTFVDFDDSGFFTINGTNNTSVGTHSFIDINVTVGASSGGTASVEFQDLRIEELTSNTLNTNSNQTVVNATQSVNNPATWTWSENPALCILDYLTNTVYGRGIPYSDIDLDSFMVEADYCDELITLKDSSGNDIPNQKRYTCNGFVNPEKTSFDIINELLSSCRGALVSPNDKFKLVIDKPTNSVFTFDEDNIVGGWVINGAGVRQRKNKAVSRFFDKDNNYDEAILVTTSSGGTDFYAQDNSRTLQADLSFPFTNENIRADILAQHFLKQSRLSWKVSFTATIDCLKVEAMDLIAIKHPAVGWDSGALSNGKLFRVNTVELLSEDTIKITAEEYDTSVYTFDVNTPPASPSTNLPDPQLALPPTNLVLDSTDLLVNKDGTIIERIKATWTPPNFGYVSNYEIAYKTQGDTGFSIIATDSTTFYISPVNSANNINTGIYFVKVRAVYPTGKRSSWYPSNEGLEHEVSGKSTKPARPTGFHYEQLQDYTRSLEFVPPIDPDFAGVQIRFSSNLSETYDNMTPLHAGVVTESPFNFTILSEGTYRFGIKSIDTSGNESDLATFTTGALTDNPNFEVLASYYPRLLGWNTVGTAGSSAFIDTAGDLTSTPSSNAEWDDLGTTTWDNWNEWGFASETMIYYTDGFEFGTTLTFRPVIQSSQVGTVTHQIRIVRDSVSGTSGFSSSDYTDPDGNDAWFTPSGSVEAKAIRTRTEVTGVNSTLQSLGILLDGKQTEETLLNIDTSTLSSSYRVSAGHIYLPLQKDFNNITTIQITFINAGGLKSSEIISKTTTVNGKLAPEVKLHHSSSTADATIDVIVRGY